jgi:natural product biosynthesis luciferase-like monooxygenase protein
VLGNVPFGERRARTLDAVDTLRALWAGDAVEFPAPDGPQTVRTYPAPTRPDIPLWLTAMSGPDTFRLAGERGLNLLTSYIQQTREQLAENIRAYRKAFAAAGTGRRPHVTLMLHACVAATRAEALSVAEEALVTYQDSFLDLARSGVAPAADRIGLARFSARQYATERGLIGSPEEAARRLRQLAAMGVDEVACLVDFGLSAERVAETLRLLADCRAFV